MIISNQHRYIYLRVPRTGSTSVTSFVLNNFNLEDSIIHAGLEADSAGETLNVTGLLLPEKNIVNSFNDDMPHYTLKQIVSKNVLNHSWQEYQVYAVCRDPVDRFKSFCRQLYNFYKLHESNQKKQKQFLEYIGYSNIVFDKLIPQHQWLMFNDSQINAIYKYNKIPDMVQSIANYYGNDASQFKNYSLRSSPNDQIELPIETINRIHSYYALDYQLYSSLE